jgi:VanZ family protein
VSDGLSGRFAWTAVGGVLLAGLVTVSVVPVGTPVEATGADKLQHLLAYALLMYWWGMVQPGRRVFWLTFLPLLGVTLELVQNLLPGRFMEGRDMLANLAGVSLAWLVLRTRAGRLLAHVDGKFFDRGNPGPP